MATLIVNLVGSFLLGALVVAVTELWRGHPLVRPALSTGVPGWLHHVLDLRRAGPRAALRDERALRRGVSGRRRGCRRARDGSSCGGTVRPEPTWRRRRADRSGPAMTGWKAELRRRRNRPVVRHLTDRLRPGSPPKATSLLGTLVRERRWLLHPGRRHGRAGPPRPEPAAGPAARHRILRRSSTTFSTFAVEDRQPRPGGSATGRPASTSCSACCSASAPPPSATSSDPRWRAHTAVEGDQCSVNWAIAPALVIWATTDSSRPTTVMSW